MKPAIPDDETQAIGGYFSLEVGRAVGALPYPEAHRFQSARAALVALLRAVRPRRLWLPRLVCDAVPAAALHARVPVSFYAMDDATGAPKGVDLARGDLLLFVDYLGVMDHAAKAVLAEFAPGQVVLDHAQAFFKPPGDCLATLYSPRKFFGVPDGGLLVTQAPVTVPETRDVGSFDRCRHLLHRLALPPEHGYPDFQAAEATLEDCEPHRMSALTEHLLRAADREGARRRREHNFAELQARLGPTNLWPFPSPRKAPALAYPYLRGVARDDARMRAARLFVPTYWGEARERCPTGSIEARLLERLLPLPVDQRYDVGAAYMARLAQALAWDA